MPLRVGKFELALQCIKVERGESELTSFQFELRHSGKERDMANTLALMCSRDPQQLLVGEIHKKIDFSKQQPESDFGVCMLSGRLG